MELNMTIPMPTSILNLQSSTASPLGIPNPQCPSPLSLRVRQTIRRDPIGWASTCGINLCSYQHGIALAIKESILHKLDLTFVVIFRPPVRQERAPGPPLFLAPFSLCPFWRAHRLCFYHFYTPDHQKHGSRQAFPRCLSRLARSLASLQWLLEKDIQLEIAEACADLGILDYLNQQVNK
jgi:hypothetical protein